jgi:N-acetylmuramoyl-L-alanine amidase
VRPENFVGVGNQNFSQTKTDGAEAASLSEESKLSQAKNLGKSFGKIKFNRYALHAIAIAAVLTMVGIGRINASEAISTKGTGSTKNQTSIITTGAILANSTQNIVADEVSQKATELTNMSTLSTAGDEFLANKSSVIAAGAPSREIISYKVKNGDTLSSISAKFNITTDTIKWANNITDENSIKPDTNLTILPVNGILHTAQGGDDVLALAQKYQSNASMIESFNGLEGKAPEEGVQLIIPDGVKPAPVISVSRVASSFGTSNTGYFSSSRFSGIANSYYWGQCTWYVASRRPVPSNWGNAISWYYNAQRAGYSTGSSPQSGAIGWERNNHVVYVESVNGDGTVTISEMNWGGRPGVLHYRTEPASRFLYIY